MTRTISLLALSLLLWPSAETHAQLLTWEQIYSEQHQDDIVPEALGFGRDGTLYAYGSREVIAFSPGASEWEYRCSSDAGCRAPHIRELDALGPDTLLAVGDGLNRSTDGGETWALLFETVRPSYAQGAVFETSTGRLLAITRTGFILYSDDRGATWEEAPYPSPDPFLPYVSDFAELPGGRLLAACMGGIALSDDGGTTWYPSPIWQDQYPNPYGGVALETLQSGRVLAFFGGGTGTNVHVSEDGETWELRPLLLHPGGDAPVWPDLMTSNSARDEVFVVTRNSRDRHVFRTRDEGRTWEHIGRGPHDDDAWVTIHALGPDDRLYATVSLAGHGPIPERGVYRSHHSLTAPVEQVPPAPLSRLRATVSPNPVRTTAALSFSSALNEAITYEVYDALGRRVLGPTKVTLNSGAWREQIDVEPWRPGVYVLRAHSPSGITSTLFSVFP